MSKTAKIIIFSVIGVVLLCCGGGAAGLFFIVNSSTKAPKAATEEFLGALEAGNAPAAYKLLCGATQEHYDQSAFADYVKQHQPKSHDMDWGGSYSNSNGTETATITAKITMTAGGTDSHQFELLKEAGAWKVCGEPY